MRKKISSSSVNNASAKDAHQLFNSIKRRQKKALQQLEEESASFEENFGSVPFIQLGTEDKLNDACEEITGEEEPSEVKRLRKWYFDYIKDQKINLHLPHYSSIEQKFKQKNEAMVARVWFDIDSLVVKMCDLIYGGNFEKLDALGEELSNFVEVANTYHGAKAHKKNVLKFQALVASLEEGDPDTQLLSELERYFVKKRNSYKWFDFGSNADGGKRAAKKDLNQAFHQISLIGDAVKEGNLADARTCYSKAEEIISEVKESGCCTYKLKQAFLALSACVIPDQPAC